MSEDHSSRRGRCSRLPLREPNGLVEPQQRLDTRRTDQLQMEPLMALRVFVSFRFPAFAFYFAP
jgi:hypothetical protein